jgi:hypothetical protein
MTHKNKEKKEVAPVVVPAVDHTGISCGIRRTEGARWVVEEFEHSFDTEGNILASRITRTSKPQSWSFTISTVLDWTSRAKGL